MPKVGQWGQLCLRVVQLQNVLQINQVKLPQTKIINTYKRILGVTNLHHLQIYNKIYNIQRSVSVQQFAKHAPIALTLLDCLHWLQSQKALNNQRK